MSNFAVNVRRLMARRGLTLCELVRASGLHERTLKAILSGASKPHARTLHRLAAGLEVSTDELFESSTLAAHQLFDRRTNPLVEEMCENQPELFAGWSDADFEELYSHFGTGGALSTQGATELIAAMNAKRATHHKVALLLESSEASVLIGMVDLLYQRIAVSDL